MQVFNSPQDEHLPSGTPCSDQWRVLLNNGDVYGIQFSYIHTTTSRRQGYRIFNALAVIPNQFPTRSFQVVFLFLPFSFGDLTRSSSTTCGWRPLPKMMALPKNTILNCSRCTKNSGGTQTWCLLSSKHWTEWSSAMESHFGPVLSGPMVERSSCSL